MARRRNGHRLQFCGRTVNFHNLAMFRRPIYLRTCLQQHRTCRHASLDFSTANTARANRAVSTTQTKTSLTTDEQEICARSEQGPSRKPHQRPDVRLWPAARPAVVRPRLRCQRRRMGPAPGRAAIFPVLVLMRPAPGPADGCGPFVCMLSLPRPIPTIRPRMGRPHPKT